MASTASRAAPTARCAVTSTTPMPLVTAGVVALFGGLTLYLNAERFITLKPTLVYLLFAAALALVLHAFAAGLGMGIF